MGEILVSDFLEMETNRGNLTQPAAHDTGITQIKQGEIKAVFSEETFVHDPIKAFRFEQLGNYLRGYILFRFVVPVHRGSERLIDGYPQAIFSGASFIREDTDEVVP